MEATSQHPKNSTTGRSSRAPQWLRSGLRAVDFVAPTLAQRLMQRLYFKPGRLPLKPAQAAVLEKGTRFELEVNGVPVVGRAWGEGRAVWLVHGWGGHLGQLTPLVEPLMASGFRVIGFDWPAHGASAGEVSSLLHALKSLKQLETLVGAPYGVVAHSFGAAATTLALKNGLAAQRVVYQAPVARLRQYIERFSSAMELTPAMEQRFISGAEAWLEAPFSEFEPLKDVASIRTPALILHSRDDQEVTVSDGELLVANWPGATLRVSEGLGHRRIVSDPECIAQTVNFLVNRPEP